MFKKGLRKLVVASGLLAVILIFLGVNYVPIVSALTPKNANPSNVESNVSPDYIDRHMPAVAKPAASTSPDWVERHMPAAVQPAKDSAPDWIERHLPASSTYPDWVERHSP